MHIETTDPLANRRELIWGAGMLAALGLNLHVFSQSGETGTVIPLILI